MEFTNANGQRTTASANNPFPVTTSGGAGSPNFNTGQASAGANAAVLVPARSGRNSVTIENLGTTDVFLGPSGVSATSGHLLPGVKGATITIPTSAAIYGVAATGTQAISFMETY